MEIVDRYHEKSEPYLSSCTCLPAHCELFPVLRLEREILIKPKMKTVRERTYPSSHFSGKPSNTLRFHVVHILSGDLVLHKRTLTPVKSLVYGLRRYDLDRCIALVGSSAPEKDKDKVVGFMSHQSKVYLVSLVNRQKIATMTNMVWR